MKRTVTLLVCNTDEMFNISCTNECSSQHSTSRVCCYSCNLSTTILKQFNNTGCPYACALRSVLVKLQAFHSSAQDGD